MVLAIEKEVPITEGVQVEVHDGIVRVEGPRGTLQRDFWYPGIVIRVEADTVCVGTALEKKTQKSIVGTYASHISNMISGVSEAFQYKLKLVYSHFPIQVKVEGNVVSIENFLGERKPRTAKVLGGCLVAVQGDELIVTGIDKEHVGQTAANIEQATRIKGRDPRVFQDGIYLIEKGLEART
jgi:large subunit ribosomal protein L6